MASTRTSPRSFPERSQTLPPTTRTVAARGGYKCAFVGTKLNLSWGVGGEKSCSPVGVRVVRSCFACAKLDWWSIAERGEVIGVLVGVSGGTLVLGRFSPDSGCCWIGVQRLPVRASCGARLTPSPPRSSPCALYAPGRPSTTNLVVDCGTWASGLGGRHVVYR